MAYGLKYIAQYTGLDDYSTQFLIKDYTGIFQNVIAARPATVQTFDLDEPKPGVKGSSLNVTLLNKNQTLPLSDFFSPVDNNCMVIHKWREQVLFAGFLVQDDCNEVMLDATHPIDLIATDSLGLLKDVPLNTANSTVGDGNRIISGIQSESNGSFPPFADYWVIYSITTGAIVGDTCVIEGTPGSDGVYTVMSFVASGGTTIFTLDRPLPFFVPASLDYTTTFITAVNLADRLSLAYIIRICLHATNLLLSTDVYATIKPDTASTPRFLEEAFESCDNYQDGNNVFKSCYDVLNIILERFNATLFQAEGVWNIKRSDEHRYYDNEIPGYRYNSSMVYQNPVFFDDIFTASPAIPTLTRPDTYPVAGIRKSILRGYNFVKEQFDFKQSVVLKNYTLQLVGPLISSSTVGDIRTNNYEFPVSSKWLHFYGDTAYISVVTQLFVGGAELELERFVYQPKITNGLPPGYQNFANTQFNDIEVIAGDGFDFECSIKASAPPGGTVAFRFGFFLQVSAGEYYALVNTAGVGADEFAWNQFFLTPIQSIGNAFNVLAPNAVYYSFFKLSETGIQKQVPPFPATGLLRIRMYGTTDTNVSQPNVDAIWNSIRLTMYSLIAGSTQVIGQTHQDTQQRDIKNNETTEIKIDDSPSNFLNGTLFLPTFTGLVQDRTFLWKYPTGNTNRVGFFTTFEQLFWRRKERLKMEGSMRGLIQSMTRRFFSALDFAIVNVPPLSNVINLINIDVSLLTIAGTFTITGSASNNGTYTVEQIGLTLPTQVIVTETVTPALGESGIVTINNVPRHISMLTLLRYTGFPGKNFIFGRMAIDFANNSFSATFWELWQDGEIDADLIQIYIFKYLYQTIQ